MINILLCGSLGTMGKATAAAAAESGDCTVAAGVDTRAQAGSGDFASFDEVSGKYDCIVDFSHPSVTDGLLSYALKTKTPAVICTTGLSQEQVKKIHAASKEIPVFFSANMSLGVNLMVALCKKAAAFFGSEFDIEIIEKHHNRKVDAPSGTAAMIADEINSAAEDKYHYVYERRSVRRKREPLEIGIHSVRGGNIVGEHEVLFAGHDECLSIKHTAASREIFAVGAVNAARFLASKPAGLYSMKDILE